MAAFPPRLSRAMSSTTRFSSHGSNALGRTGITEKVAPLAEEARLPPVSRLEERADEALRAAVGAQRSFRFQGQPSRGNGVGSSYRAGWAFLPHRVGPNGGIPRNDDFTEPAIARKSHGPRSGPEH